MSQSRSQYPAPSPGERTVVDCVTVGPFQENTFILRRTDQSEVILVDPGDEADRLIQTIGSHGWSPRAVVNTHAHLDHVGAVRALVEHFDIPFYLHPDDLPTLRQAPAAARLYGVRVPDVPRVDFELRDGMELELAGLPLKVMHTPGHTPGGVTLLVDGRAFVGDALFCGSIGRTDLPGGNTETLFASLFNRLLSLPDDTIVHSGHGPDTTIGRERHRNPFLVHPPKFD